MAPAEHSGEQKKQITHDRITTTIEREWLAQIIAGTKKIEYRQIKPYWTKRFAKVSLPFELRLLNGMNPPVPEVTVLIHRITKDRRAGEYQLHIKKVLGFTHWDKRRAEAETVNAITAARRRSPVVSPLVHPLAELVAQTPFVPFSASESPLAFFPPLSAFSSLPPSCLRLSVFESL